MTARLPITLLVENACIASRGSPYTDSATIRLRRDVSRELERQVQRAIWRAERRGRGLPLNVRQGAAWIMGQRRKMAHELYRAFLSLSASPALARAAAVEACNRFPRDGIVIVDADTRRPRERGTAPRQRATNPRARGESPRQLGTSPRQERRRAAADLSTADPTMHAVVQNPDAPRSALVPPPSAPPPIEGPLPQVSDVLQQLANDPDLTPVERSRAQIRIQNRRRQEEEWRQQEAARSQQREQDHPPSTTEPA